jgi:hypothetical protein
MKNKLSKMSVTLLRLTIALFFAMNLHAQEATAKPIQKSTLSIEVDPIVPAVLHGFSGHLMWKPKKSDHFVFGLAVIVGGKLPPFIINLNSKNRDMGWNYKINQGLGIEVEYYYKEATKGWFSGIQLFTQEINITNDNVPEVKKHRTNTGMAVITSGYKWYPFKKKEHFYLKPWAGIGYSGVMKGAFSEEIIHNTTIGAYTYDISRFTPYAAVHLGYTF